MGTRAEPAFVEVVERRADYDPDRVDVIRPSEVRLNGTPLLCPRERDVVVVERVEVGAEEYVKVTLTLYARRVVMGHEPQQDPS